MPRTTPPPQDAGTEANAPSPEPKPVVTMAFRSATPPPTPGLVVSWIEQRPTFSKTETTSPGAQNAVLEAGSAVSDTGSTGPKAENAGLEAGSAGSEAVIKGADSAESEYFWSMPRFSTADAPSPDSPEPFVCQKRLLMWAPPGLAVSGIEQRPAFSKTETTSPESQKAVLEAGSAVSDTGSTGSKAEYAGLEAGSAGSEAVIEGADSAESTEYIWRRINILTEMIQDLRMEQEIKYYLTSEKDVTLWKYIIRTLKQGAPPDPVPERVLSEVPRFPSTPLQHALHLIKGLGADCEETNFMTRMALLTADICFEALEYLPHRRDPKFGEHELDEPLLHILISYVLQKNEHTDLFKKFINNYGFLQVDCFNSKGVSILYVAIKYNNLEMVKAIIEQKANCLKVSQENDSALHAAVGYPTIVKYLVERRYPEFRCYNNEGYTPLHLAVISKQLQQVELIADANVLYLNDIVYKGMKTCLHLAVDYESVDIVKAIFERLERRFGHRAYSEYVITNQLDENGDTPFQAALQGENKDIIELFLCNGAFLSEKGKNGESALEIIATRFKKYASNILCNVFDHSISISAISGENTIDYGSFTDPNDTSQIHVIEQIAQSDQSDLLLHPVIQSYLYLKWNYFLPLFYMIILVHAIFLITFNVLVANTFYYRDTANVTVLTISGAVPWIQLYDWRYWTLITLMYAIILVLIAQESYTIYITRRWIHLVDRETCMRLVFLMLAIFLPMVLAFAKPADWQRHLACAALLLGWLQAMFLLSQFPSWGSYVLRFGRVAFNLLKILSSMLFLIIGFSFCFMIQYRSTPPFDGPAAAFFKTLVMMSSEFDYEDLFGEHHDKELRDTILVVRLLFGVFVVFIAIGLMSFMTDTAGSDIYEPMVMAEKIRLEKQVKLLLIIEAVVYNDAFVKIFKKLFKRGRYYKKITYSTANVTKWNLICAIVMKKYPEQNDSDNLKASNISNNTSTSSKISTLICKLDEVDVEQSFEVCSSDKLNKAFVKISKKKDVQTKKKKEQLHDVFLDKPEVEEKGNNDWVREAISKQDESMRSLAEDLQQVSRANEQMRSYIEVMNSQMERLISNQTQTSDGMKELIVEIKKKAKQNQ